MEHSDNRSNTSLPEEQTTSESASVNNVMTPIPMFQEELQHSWFTLLEGQFKMRRITSQESKFYILGCHLPPHILKKVAHVVSKMPKENPYDILKQEVLARTSNSKEAQFRQLMSYSDRDNQRPSDVLHQMQELAQNLDMEEQTLYRFWSAALPRNVKTVLALQPKDTPLSCLAEMADQVYECCGSPVVQQVSKSAVEETPDLVIYGDYAKQLVRRLEALELANKANNRRRSISRSRRQRSKSRTHIQGVCYYHRRFGDEARKCVIPCSYKNRKEASGNVLARQ